MSNLSPVVHFNGQKSQLDFDSPLEGYRDLFGELISITPYENTSKAKKSSKKLQFQKKKNLKMTYHLLQELELQELHKY